MIKLAITNIGNITWLYYHIRHNRYKPALVNKDRSGQIAKISFYIKGSLHNVDGPAVIDCNLDSNKWYVDGREYLDFLTYAVAAEQYKDGL